MSKTTISPFVEFGGRYFQYYSILNKQWIIFDKLHGKIDAGILPADGIPILEIGLTTCKETEENECDIRTIEEKTEEILVDLIAEKIRKYIDQQVLEEVLKNANKDI